MFNWNIVGHQKIINFLETSLVNDKLAHAYLFFGLQQLGKKTVAKKFAQSIMCYWGRQEEGSLVDKELIIPCGSCQHCQQVQKNIHPDIIFLRKKADKKNIKVEQIREFKEKLSERPFFKAYKIAIVENIEDLNLSSANALLKTLEEPTQRTIIILLANKISNLPKTILSRVQTIKFLPVDKKNIYDYLVNQGAPSSLAVNFANVSGGRPGRAIAFLKDDELWPSYLKQLNLFLSLTKSSVSSKFLFVEKLLPSPGALLTKAKFLESLLNLWQLVVRDLILRKLGQNDKIINVVAKDKIDWLSKKYTLLQLVGLEKNIAQAKKDLKINANPKLVLENLLLSF